ncbi:RagB/SusD family nutrient uptake outer membrane protein [Chitinophaga sp. GbtcB8]|uniref:RagB/SusD family nutrient uptake outer membrane protein n=1 Tax=Chitinophaga sp. GbtcB8 TaxID=2824753 RepID=UPI001C2FC102|nr:RagB/SusD family nutrient uptake outer membrane protein [Chitinophaga sp. GbtcB8]
MKNKLSYNLRYGLWALLAGVLLASCGKDFLNVYPETSLSSAGFYQTQAQLEQALVAAYAPLRSIVNTGVYMDEMRSDNTFFTRYSANRGFEPSRESLPEILDDANSSAVVNSPGNRYGDDYSGIAMINIILSRLEKIALPAGAKDSIAGEALFLRAFYYFDLVQHYGGVPLHLEEITAPDQSFKPRNTVNEVYAQIISDLGEAIPKLQAAASFPQSGRATKGAAKMLLAYVYMSAPDKNYAAAETELLDITHMNYTLLPGYAAVFDPANKNNSESIFEVQYLSDLVSGQQSGFAWAFAPKTTNPDFLMGYKGSSMNIFSGWNVPTQEMVSSYEAGDLRLDASVAVVEGTISGVEDFTATAVKSAAGYTPQPGKSFFYMIKKYYHPPYIAEFNTPENWPVYRYSGALLLLAECLVRENKAQEALPYLNRVRTRAGLPALATATLDNIADEMRHELAFENHRWTDLIRLGKAIPVIKAKGDRLKTIYPWLLPNSFNITENRLIYPIPFREIQINPQLTQNPGY